MASYFVSCLKHRRITLLLIVLAVPYCNCKWGCYCPVCSCYIFFWEVSRRHYLALEWTLRSPPYILFTFLIPALFYSKFVKIRGKPASSWRLCAVAFRDLHLQRSGSWGLCLIPSRKERKVNSKCEITNVSTYHLFWGSLRRNIWRSKDPCWKIVCGIQEMSRSILLIFDAFFLFCVISSQFYGQLWLTPLLVPSF